MLPQNGVRSVAQACAMHLYRWVFCGCCCINFRKCPGEAETGCGIHVINGAMAGWCLEIAFS